MTISLAMLLFGLSMMAGLLFQRRKRIAKLLPKRKPKALPEQAPQKTLRQVHDEDHDFWLEAYKEVLQANCDHLYHNQSWYTCRICGQEEPWEYENGCTCRVETIYTMSSSKPEHVLQRRAPSCTVHGKDYKLMPLSDRKVGPYGGTNYDWHSDSPYERSRAKFKDRAWRDVALPTRQPDKGTK